jgi:hypothetical protein
MPPGYPQKITGDEAATKEVKTSRKDAKEQKIAKTNLNRRNQR